MRIAASQPARAGFTWVHFLVLAALSAFLIALLMPAVHGTKEQADLIACKDNLQKIGMQLRQYADANGGAFPLAQTVDNPHADLLACLSAAKCLGDPKMFYCPAARQDGPAFSEQKFNAGIIGYFYYAARGSGDNSRLSKFLLSGLNWPRKLDVSMEKKSWLMSDIWISGLPTSHAGFRKGVNYLMLDGSVDFIGESPRQAFH